MLCCLEASERARTRLGHIGKAARDDEALDLRGTLIDLEDLGVTHQLLNGVFRVETIAAKDLHCISG